MIQEDWHFSVAPLVQMIPREDSGAVLLDLRQDRFLGLDQIGVLLWRAFAAGHTPQEAAHWLATRYQGADESQILADIFHFLDQMEGILLPTSLRQDGRLKEYGRKRSTSPRDLSRALLFRFSQIIATSHLSEWLEAWLLLLWVHWHLQQGHLVALARRLNALPTS
jgi:hypothetical protein